MMLAAIMVAVAPCPVARAQQPLSANEWVSGRGPAPGSPVSAWRPGDHVPADAKRLRPRPRATAPSDAAPAPVADSAAAAPVGVTRLDDENPDAVGIISARQAGLPPDFWDGTTSDDAIRRMRATDPRIPAVAAVFRRLLEAQLTPPTARDGAAGSFFLARVDRLLDMGGLPWARDMVRAAGADTPERFRRLFDMALMLGDEDEACSIMAGAPGIAPDFGARIFCLAKSGDWPAAALILDGASRLGQIPAEMQPLLSQFLDDSAVDGGNELAPPATMTPLAFRLHEAIGQPLPTGQLPLSYAWSDLGSNSGWKAQLEAAERLARVGAVQPHTLHRLYSAQRPAASGGVWERAAAVQALDAALDTADPARIAPALLTAHQRMDQAGLRDAFARIYAPRLDPAMLPGASGRLALWLRLWADETELSQAPADKIDAALLALAEGQTPAPETDELAAIAPIFAEPKGQALPARGPALLDALADADAAVDGDMARAVRGIAALNAMGMVADARRIATQIALSPLLTEAAR